MNTVKIKEGHEAVLIDKPLVFGHQGARPETVKSGRVTVLWTTEVVQVNVQPTNLEFKIWGLRLADNRRASKFDDDLLSTGLNVRFKVTDPVAYANLGIDDWFGDHMRPMFDSRIRQEYAAIRWAEIGDFPTYSTKINAALRAGLNAELKKAWMPIEVVDVVVQ